LEVLEGNMKVKDMREWGSFTQFYLEEGVPTHKRSGVINALHVQLNLSEGLVYGTSVVGEKHFIYLVESHRNNLSNETIVGTINSLDIDGIS